MSPAKKEDQQQVKKTWLKVRVTEDRLQRWKDAANRAKEAEDDEDLDFSAWARRALNRAMAAEESTTQDQRGGGKR